MHRNLHMVSQDLVEPAKGFHTIGLNVGRLFLEDVRGSFDSFDEGRCMIGITKGAALEVVVK